MHRHGARRWDAMHRHGALGTWDGGLCTTMVRACTIVGTMGPSRGGQGAGTERPHLSISAWA